MKGFTARTPEGTKDKLYAECCKRRRVEHSVTELFQHRGYWEIMTPEVEYYDLFINSGDVLPQESMIKTIDRSGKIIVMRPDNTTPIARVAATQLKNAPLPLRLYYNQTVFRSDESNQGKRSEIPQCGIELLGAGGIRGDIEVIVTAIQAFERAGARNFHIELGHADFFRALANELGADSNTTERMRRYIENKNFAALSDTLEPYYGHKVYDAMKELSSLFGGIEVLNEARKLAGNVAKDCLDYLEEIYNELRLCGYENEVKFDLGLVHQIDYYTGVIFRGYAQGSGRVVLSGGRYDTLTANFGRALPATGFAIDMDALASSVPDEQEPKLETVIFAEKGMLRRALEIIDASGEKKAVLSSSTTVDESMKEAARLGAKYVVILDGKEERKVGL